MNDFIITTDTGADINQYFKDKYSPFTISIPAFLDNEPILDMPYEDFYRDMSLGKISTTSQINISEATNFFEQILQTGKNIIHISISSGLSGTFNNYCVASDNLRIKYPSQQITPIDSLSVSAGQGLVYIAARRLQEEGKSYDEIVDWLNLNSSNMIHLFTVDNLFFLQRGGRISKTSAIFGAALGVKPLLCVDSSGALALRSKTRGRRKSIDEMTDWIANLLPEQKTEMMFVAHANSPDDAKYFAKSIEKQYHCGAYTTEISPVIGAHSGPGTLHVAFWGKCRP